jgi:peptidoglycan/xylan/chitin deacetylase (PgdA/CDA1 family)
MPDSIVLCYHALSERWRAPLSVTPARFRDQLRLLVDRGYRGATFLEVVRGRTPGKAVAVTFDDAFRSVVQLALPVLADLGLPATVFVPTGFVDEGGTTMSWPGIDDWMGSAHEEELTGMGWGDLERLAAAGWEIGSHTRSHPRLTELDDARLAEELAASRAALERNLGGRCLSLAYPYGVYDDRVMTAAQGAGYVGAAALPAGRLPRPRALAWPRVGVYHQDQGRRYRLKVSRLGRAARSSPLWPARPAGA